MDFNLSGDDIGICEISGIESRVFSYFCRWDFSNSEFIDERLETARRICLNPDYIGVCFRSASGFNPTTMKKNCFSHFCGVFLDLICSLLHD